MTIETQLPYSSSEAQGISAAAILGFVEAVETEVAHLHSLMLLRHGQVVAEGWWSPYGPEEPHMLFSLSKSFTSTAVGLAVEEGYFSVDDRVLSFFPDDAPAEVNEHLAAMQVRRLLSMSTGHVEDTMPHLVAQPEGNWVKGFLACPPEKEPGSHFLYNNGASYMLSAIVQKMTGQTVLDYLRPRLFEPLGIDEATWACCPRGINTGGWGLSLKTEDIARFGQLYLQRGVWRGQRVLPEAWIEAATSRQVSNGSSPESDWEQGYGYQFWRCRHGAYRGDGAFGQFCLVMPDQAAVLAITAGVGDMQAVLNLVWQHLLPAFEPDPLPEDRAAQAALELKLASLTLPLAEGEASSPAAARVSGRRYVFEGEAQEVEADEPKLEAVSLDFGREGCVLSLWDERGEHRIRCGSGAWFKGSSYPIRGEAQPVAASGAWTTEDTYVMKLYFYRTPYCQTVTCRFEEERVIVNRKQNVSFGPTERPELVGRID